MPKTLVEGRVIRLPPLPRGSESSLGVVDQIYTDGSVRRLWTKDDGVQVIGITHQGDVVAIREKGYIHLVGGYVEPGEEPAETAAREFIEETGCTTFGEVKLISAFKQDSGGSERIIWLYMISDCDMSGANESEKGIEALLYSPHEFWHLLIDYLQPNTTKKPIKGQRGGTSLLLATLVFQKMGLLSFKT